MGKAKKLALCALLVALALALSLAERLVPMPLPGMKLGLANVVTLVALCLLRKVSKIIHIVSANVVSVALVTRSKSRKAGFGSSAVNSCGRHLFRKCRFCLLLKDPIFSESFVSFVFDFFRRIVYKTVHKNRKGGIFPPFVFSLFTFFSLSFRQKTA